MDADKKYERYEPSYTVGLTEREVLLSEQQGLTNTAQDKITKTTGQIIHDNVLTLFNAFNLAIGICLALVGAWTNMIYLSIIILNICIGIVQEIRAKKLIENLSLLSAQKATVVRDGKDCEIPVESLVLDDITILSMGKQICSDSVIVHGEIEVNESLLTGEADPILKLPGDTLLSGSFVVSGKCYARVEHVGADNFVSQLAQGVKKHKSVNSELLRSMRKVTMFTGFFIIPIGVLLFLEAYFLRSDSLANSVVSTSAALLGMLPKGLILIISTSLAAGVVKLSKKKVLVQELHCIETLAHVDILCLDKTGTITEGKMRVSEVHIFDESVIPIPVEQAIHCFVGAVDDNNATFMALKEYFPANHAYNPVVKMPFSSQRKWSGATFENIGTIIMGAPEILGKSSFPDVIEKAQQSGERVLCLGYCPEPIENNMVPYIEVVAAICLNDPIRKDAKETLAFFKQGGVEVKIISGDNPLTVSNIARQAGLENFDSYIDLSDVTAEEEIRKAASKYSIFGRVAPNQKSRLIKALQAEGHTVAMTGDGVNDVLALREADCSIAMASGSDAARQVSQLVLLNSDFTALPEVVMEGRRVVNNITRVAGIFFIKTIYSVLLSIFSILTMTAFPFIPIQITLVDLMIEAFPGFFLSFEPSYKKLQGSFLSTVIKRAFPYALLILFSFLTILWLSPAIGISAAEAKTVIYYLTGFISLLALAKSCRPFNKLRVFLCSAAAVGFYMAAYLFSGILKLEPITATTFTFFAVLAVLCIPLEMLLVRCVDKGFNKVTKDKNSVTYGQI